METRTKKWIEIFPKPEGEEPTGPTESMSSSEVISARFARKNWTTAQRKSAVAKAVDELSLKFDGNQEVTPAEVILVILGTEYLQGGFKGDPLFSVFGDLFG